MQHFEYLFLQRSQCRSSFSKYSRSSGALRGIPEGPFVLGIASVALVCMFSARQTSSKSASKLKTHPRCNIRLASGKPCMGKGPHAEHDRPPSTICLAHRKTPIGGLYTNARRSYSRTSPCLMVRFMWVVVTRVSGAANGLIHSQFGDGRTRKHWRNCPARKVLRCHCDVMSALSHRHYNS